ncbi:hypothetical protein BLA29_011390, partial [Euroglyphus maynei]
SDVWSYGVLVWELYTRGRIPYQDEIPKTASYLDAFIQYLRIGKRLPKPWIPDILWIVNMLCWLPEPEARPTFKMIKDMLNEITRLFIDKRADMNKNWNKSLSSLLNGTTFTTTDSTIATLINNPSPSSSSQIFNHPSSSVFTLNTQLNSEIFPSNFNDNLIKNRLTTLYEKLRSEYQSRQQLIDNDLYRMTYDNRNMRDENSSTSQSHNSQQR